MNPLNDHQQATLFKRGELVGRHGDDELWLYRGRFYVVEGNAVRRHYGHDGRPWRPPE